jgi:NAD(P)H-nitrite reductase large subunit
LKEDDIDKVWGELGMDKGAAVGLCVRSVRACPGTTFCTMGKQDALGMGMKLDSLYHGTQLPGKFKMAVSGCRINCAESSVRDFGLIGEPDGWKVVVGGNVGVTPRIADEVAKGLTDEQALDFAQKVIACYTETATKGERLGKMIDRVGLDALKSALK